MKLHVVSNALLWIIIIGNLIFFITRENRSQALFSKVDIRIIEAAIDNRIIVGMKGNIRASSVTAAAIFGYTVEEILNKSIVDLVPEELRKEHRLAFVKAFNSPENSVKIVNCYALHKNGGEIPVEVRVKMIATEIGKFAVATVTPLEQIERVN